jgi:hypothetical protein
MPADTPIPITMSMNGPSPNPLDNVSPGTKIVWTNSMTVPVTLNYPSCVSPGGTVTVAVNATTPQQNINSGAKGSYSYSYSYSPGATVDGTIDVS